MSEFEFPDRFKITSLLICDKFLICGIDNGTIRVYPWPLSEAKLVKKKVNRSSVRLVLPNYYCFEVCKQGISHLKVSLDEGYMFVACSNGDIYQLKMNKPHNSDLDQKILQSIVWSNYHFNHLADDIFLND